MSENADVRFTALKVFTDYVTQFMCEEKIYQPQENSQTTQWLNELLLKKKEIPGQHRHSVHR